MANALSSRRAAAPRRRVLSRRRADAALARRVAQCTPDLADSAVGAAAEREQRAQARGAHLSFAVQVAAMVASYALQVVLAHGLGQEGFGVYSYVLAITGPLSLLSGLGLATVALRFVPIYRARGDRELLSGLIRSVERVALLAALAVAATGSALALVFVAHPAPLIVGLFSLPLMVQVRVQGEIARSAERFRLAFVLPLAQQVLMLVVALGAFALGGHRLGPAFALLLPSLGALVALPYQRIALRRQLAGELCAGQAPVARRELGRWLRLGLTFLAIDASQTLLGMADTLLVGALLGAKSLALYAVANSTAGFAMFPMIAVGASTVPSLPRYWEANDLDGLNRVAQRAVRWAFTPQAAITAMIVVVASPLLSLFGPHFDEARPALLLLLFAQLANTATGYIGCLMRLSGHQAETLRAISVAAALNVVAVFIGLRLDATTGAAAGTALSSLGWNLWLYRLVRRHIGVYPGIFDVALRHRPQPSAAR